MPFQVKAAMLVTTIAAVAVLPARKGNQTQAGIRAQSTSNLIREK
jgi:hypothetical protein